MRDDASPCRVSARARGTSYCGSTCHFRRDVDTDPVRMRELAKGRLVGRLFPVAVVAAALVSAAPARAAVPGRVIDKAATGLANDPVYVDPQAEKTITRAQAAAVRKEIVSRGQGPIYIAVLRAAAVNEAGGDAVGVIDELHRRLGRRGVYAVVAGGHFRAEATDLPPGEAGDLAASAFAAHHDEGITPTLVDFVDRVGGARTGQNGGGGNGGGGGGGAFGGIGLLPILLVAGLGFFVFRRFRRTRRDAEQFADVKESARLDLVALADDVQDLERRVEANPAARRDYDAALQQYERASSAFDGARNSQQLEPVAEALEEGRYLMASAEARLEGKRAARADGPVLLRPAARPVGARRRVVARRRRDTRRTRVRGVRAASRGGRSARLSPGARPRSVDAVLGRRPGVRRILRRVLPRAPARRDRRGVVRRGAVRLGRLRLGRLRR